MPLGFVTSVSAEEQEGSDTGLLNRSNNYMSNVDLVEGDILSEGSHYTIRFWSEEDQRLYQADVTPSEIVFTDAYTMF